MALIKSQAQEPREHNERKQERNCESLRLQLRDADPQVRRWAARDIVDCTECSQALVDALENEDDPSVREVIFTSITRIGDAVAVEGLVACLRSEEAGLRNEAIETMKQLPDAVAPVMLGLLMDEDSDVRIFAVNILESLRHPQVEAWLLQVNRCGRPRERMRQRCGLAG